MFIKLSEYIIVEVAQTVNTFVEVSKTDVYKIQIIGYIKENGL